MSFHFTPFYCYELRPPRASVSPSCNGTKFCETVVVISAVIDFSVASLPLLSCPSEEVEGSQGGGHRQVACRLGLYVDIQEWKALSVCQ